MASQPVPQSGRPLASPHTSEHVCERCGEAMEERKCKIICGNCGYYRDCSDP